MLALDEWPSGQASYLFGEAFLRDVTARHGQSTLPDLARFQSGRIIPFTDDYTAHNVTGSTFHRQWSEWQRSASASFSSEAEARSAQGLTVSRPLTARGIRQSAPRCSPDGSWLAYTSRTLTRYPAVRLVHPDGSGDRKLVDRNGGTGLVLDPRRQGPRLRRVPGREALRAAERPQDRRPRERPRALAHERGAGPRSRRLAGRPHRRLRAPPRRSERARGRRYRRHGSADPHPVRARHRVERAQVAAAGRRHRRLAPPPRRLARPRGGRARHGSGPEPHRGPGQGRRADLDARRRARSVPLRPRRDLEPLCASSRRPGLAAGQQRARRSVRARGLPGRPHRRLRELLGRGATTST